MQQINLIDLVIIFSEDAVEWDKYLTNRLTETIESASVQLRIVHERIENIENSNLFELTNSLVQTILIILSPDFINYLNSNSSLVKYYFDRLNSNFDNTLCLLCGVKLNEISFKIKSNLANFDRWKCLEAIEQNNDFVYNVIDTMRKMLEKNGHLSNDIYSPYSFITSIKCNSKKIDEIPNYANEYKNLDSLDLTETKSLNDHQNLTLYEKFTKPQFKLTPRKVREGNKKVFILLDKQIEESLKGKVVLEFKSNATLKSKSIGKSKQEIREVTVNKKNPYTLHFNVPDDLLRTSKVIQVTLIYEGGPQNRILGCRPLKCECKMGEFSHYLHKLNNSLVFMQQCLNLESTKELDLELCRRFTQTVPSNQASLNLLLKQEINILNNCFKLDSNCNQDKQIEDLLTGDTEKILFNSANKNNLNLEENLDENLRKISSSNLKSNINQIDFNESINLNRNQSNELPSLLHFSAAYGLQEFTKCLLQFASSLSILEYICNLKNCHGLTPAQLASRNQYYNLSKIIIDSCQNFKPHLDEPICELVNRQDCKEYVNLNALDNRSINKTSFLLDASNLDDKSSCKSSSSCSFSDMISNEQNNISISESSGSEYYNSPILSKSPPHVDKLINLDEDELDGSKSINLLPKKSIFLTRSINFNNNHILKDNFDYDVVACGVPRRAKLATTAQNLQTKNASRLESQTNTFERLTDLRLSSCSSSNKSDTKTISSNDLFKQNDLSDLQTSTLTESQIELMNIINAFKTGTCSIEEMEHQVCSNSLDQKFSTLQPAASLVKNKRSASSSHLLENKQIISQDPLYKKSNTIKTYSSNINLSNVNNTSKVVSVKQFSLSDWLHQLASKLKHKTNSPKFDKKQRKLSAVWSKRLASSNLLHKSATLSKEFEKKSDKFKISKKDNKLKNNTFPLGIDHKTDNHKLSSLGKIKTENLFSNKNQDYNLNLNSDRNQLNTNETLNKIKLCKTNWNAFKLNENNKIILNSSRKCVLGKQNLQLSSSNLNEYDKIPLNRAVPLKTLMVNNSFNQLNSNK